MMTSDLRFGVIGWGYWGPKIARNLNSLPHALVTAVADADASGKQPTRMKVQAHAHLQPHIHDIAHLDLEFADEMTAISM